MTKAEIAVMVLRDLFTTDPSEADAKAKLFVDQELGNELATVIAHLGARLRADTPRASLVAIGIAIGLELERYPRRISNPHQARA